VPSSPTVVLYRRAGCHLCDEARATLDAILEARNDAAPVVEERDIDADEGLQRRFMSTIPVVEIGDRRLELAISPGRLRRFVTDALATTAAGEPAP
jgi:glutaredoxin